jgi:nanoRNase/pAp phosphatase (c-di-AMP/oligoRNAs hydrolase)
VAEKSRKFSALSAPLQSRVSAKKILRFISAHKESLSPLLILTHDYPDPDTLASAFALSFLLENCYGMTCRIAYGGIIGRTENKGMVNILKIPAHKIRPGDFKKYSNIALMDTQPSFANNSFPKKRKATIVIDQHPSVEKPNADLVIIDEDCGATSVLMAQALLATRIQIPDRVATALAYGILSDTLNLYRANRPDIIQTYLSLLPHCDMRALARIQNPARSRRFFNSLSKAIQNASVRRRLITTHLGAVENPDLVAQVADFLLTYKGIQWTFCTGRYKAKLHMSLRINNPNAEAGEILRDLVVNKGDAGGHNGIAGGSIVVGEKSSEETWREAELQLGQNLMKRLRIPIKGDLYYPFR